MKQQTIIFVVIAIIIVAIGAVFLSGYQLPSYRTTSTQSEQPSVTPTGEVKEFGISGSSYSFSPFKITVNKGYTVRITFTSTDIGHNLVIDEFNARTNVISGGASQTIEFVADRAGTFAFYCSIPGHRATGMEGQLIVV